MKYLLPILLVISLIYLTRTYGYFYDYIGDHFLTVPKKELVANVDPQKPKFVTMGDSLMAGVGSSSEKNTLSYLLFGEIGEREERINLATPGSTIGEVIANQLPLVLKENPQTIIILVGVNDMHDFIPHQNFEQKYRYLIAELTSKTTARIILINIPYLGSDSILLPPWNFWMDFQTGQYNRIIDKIAKEKSLKVIDLYSLSREKFWKTSSLYSQDQFHPSDEGYKIWAESITPLINAN